MRVHKTWTAIALAGALLGGARHAAAQGNETRPFTAFQLGGDLGFARIENQNFVVVNATAMLRVSPNFRTDLWVPLRFGGDPFGLRQSDWDEPRDFARIPRCVRVDLGDFDPAPDRFDGACDEYDWSSHPGIHDRTYFNARVSPIRDVTLGNGSLVYGYRNSIDPDHPQLGFQTNFDLRDFGTVRAFLDDVTNPHVMGGRVAFRPQQVFLGQNWDETPDDGEVGFTAVADVAAPSRVRTAFGRPLSDRTGNLQVDSTAIGAIGVDLHYMYLWGLAQGPRVPRMGLFVFADYNRFLSADDADGLHTGARFVYRDSNGWQFRVGGEFRYIGNRYMPEYFDANYLVQSQQFALTREAQSLVGAGALTTTKLQYLQSRPGGHVAGFQAYMSLVIPIPTAAGRAPSPLPFAAFVEDADGPANASVSFLAGPFALDQLRVAAMYQRRNFDDLSGIASFDGTLIRVLGRYYFAPATQDTFLSHLHLTAQYDRRFFLTDQGGFDSTNDFSVTLGYTAGSN